MENNNEAVNKLDLNGKKSKNKKFVIILGILIALAVYLISGFRLVSATEVAVVERFGKIVAVQPAGVHYGLRGIDFYNKIQINQQNIRALYTTATSDIYAVKQIVQTQFTVDSKMAESLYLKFLNTHVDSIIKPILSQSIKEVTSKYTIEDLITKRAELGQAITDNARARLDGYGIKIISIEIVNVELPADYKAALAQKTEAP
ncbi:MAG: SPFH domain-containing protein [Firmicutes bacterium]|nr:SPFH domain-containing protein [Bacillota bacterium]